MHQDILDMKISKGTEVYGLTLRDGQIVPFRLLNNKEHSLYQSSLLNGIPEFEIWIHVFQLCVVGDWWKNLLKMEESLLENLELPAGIISTVGKFIFTASNIDQLNELQQTLNVQRGYVGTVDCQIKSVIMQVFPSYNLKTLEQTEFQELIRLFAMAESVLLERGIIEKPYEITANNQNVKQSGVLDSRKIAEETRALRNI